MRIPQKIGTKGSLKWIQVLVNEHSNFLNQEISIQLSEDPQAIDWISPLKQDDYAEYRDQKFLDKLDLNQFNEQLSEFWPKQGPQWDALGKTDNEIYFLVEAKANIPEIKSSCFAKAEKSKRKIYSSISDTKSYLKIPKDNNWIDGFYQYSNRLAHLYFLRKICDVNSYLVFIYFCNDKTHIPTSRVDWEGAINKQKNLMSIKKHEFQRYILDIFIDVNDLL